MRKGRIETTSYFEFGAISEPSAPTSGVRLYSPANNELAWNGIDAFARVLSGALTADRTYDLPDQSGTIALLSDTGSVAGQVVFPGAISPTDTGTVNNWEPAGLSSAYRINWTGAAGALVTGLSGGTSGRRVFISNATTSQVLCLVHGSTLSTAGNRFSFTQLGKSNHLYVFPGEGLELIYNAGVWSGDATVGLRNINNNNTCRVYTQTASSGTSVSWTGIVHTSAGGTISTPALTNTFSGMFLRTQGTTGTTAGTQSGTRSQGIVMRGAAAGMGGWHFSTRWLMASASANSSAFVGLAPSAAPGNVNASTLLNQVGFQVDPTQTTLRIGSNDNTGAATVTDLGASFPYNTTAVYEIHLFALSNNSSIQYAIHRLDNLTILPAVGSLTTDLPASTTILGLHVWTCNRTDAATCQINWADSWLMVP